MGIHRLNHAVLYVRDLEHSAAFYRGVLGFEPAKRSAEDAIFLRASDSSNDHDLALFEVGTSAERNRAGESTVGLYHLAWEVQTLGDLEHLQHDLAQQGALVGGADHGTAKSLYAQDPDGLEFELVWVIPAHLVTGADQAYDTRRLDLPRQIARYGRDLQGGLGVSVPLGVTVP